MKLLFQLFAGEDMVVIALDVAISVSRDMIV